VPWLTLWQDIIAERRANNDAGKRQDLLSLFMSTPREDNQPYVCMHVVIELLSCVQEDSELRDVIVNFLFAGRDTTASNLSWLFWELLNHPAVMSRLYEEIDSVLAGRDPTYADAQEHLPYLTVWLCGVLLVADCRRPV
jgi:cytochrome P450